MKKRIINVNLLRSRKGESLSQEVPANWDIIAMMIAATRTRSTTHTIHVLLRQRRQQLIITTMIVQRLDVVVQMVGSTAGGPSLDPPIRGRPPLTVRWPQEMMMNLLRMTAAVTTLPRLQQRHHPPVHPA
jgi:hypothetical protein